MKILYNFRKGWGVLSPKTLFLKAFLLFMLSFMQNQSFAQTSGPRFPIFDGDNGSRTFRPCDTCVELSISNTYVTGSEPTLSGYKVTITLPEGLSISTCQQSSGFGYVGIARMGTVQGNSTKVFEESYTANSITFNFGNASTYAAPVPLTDQMQEVYFFIFVNVSCDAKDFYQNGGNMAFKVRHQSTTSPLYDITRTTRSVPITWPAPSITYYSPASISNATTNNSYSVIMNVENGGLDGYYNKSNNGFGGNNNARNIHVWFNLPVGVFSIGTVEIGDGTNWVDVTSSYNAASNILAITDAQTETIYTTTTAIHNTGGANSGYKVRFQLNTLGVCNPPSHSWQMYTGWACEPILDHTQWCDISRGPFSVTFPQETPVLQAIPTPKNIRCHDGSGEYQILKLVNISSVDTAFNSSIFIQLGGSGVGTDGIITPIDRTMISYEIHRDGGVITTGGGSISAYSNMSTDITTYGCTANANAVKNFTSSIPALGPLDTMYIKFYYYNCPYTDACTRPTGYDRYTEEWTFYGSWKNRCGINFDLLYSLGKGYELMMPNGTPTTFPVQQATNIRHNESLFFGLGYQYWYPNEQEVILPVGFVFDGNLADVYMTDQLRNCYWNPTTFTQVGNVLRFQFPVSSAPSCWTSGMYYNAEFQVKLRYDCNIPGAGNASNTIQFASFYEYDPLCPKIKYGCDDNRVVSICVVPPCGGGGIVPDFQDMVRVNYGAPDNDNNYLPDGTGSVNVTQIRRYGFANQDSFKHIYQGHIIGGSGTLTNVYVENDIPWTDLFLYEVKVRVVDMPSGTVNMITLPMSSPFINVTVLGGHTYVKVDANAAVASGYIYDNDDTVRVEVYGRFNTVPAGGNIMYYETLNLIYASTYPNPPVGPDRLVCGPDIFGQYLTIGSYYTTYSYYSGNHSTCDNIAVSDNFYFSMGPCCTYYERGNWFRKEYRAFAYLDTVTVTIPSPQFYLNTAENFDITFRHSHGDFTFNNVTPDAVMGNVYKFRVSKFLTPPYGSATLLASDEGFSGTATINLLPTCSAVGGYSVPFAYNFNGINGQPGGNVSGTGSFTYYKPLMDLTPQVQLVYVAETQAIWEVKLKNISAIATGENVFMGFKDIAGAYDITEVREIYNNVAGTISNVITEVGTDIYGLGDFNHLFGTGSVPYERWYRITANTEYCTEDTLRVITGNDCAGYPASVEAFTCATQTFPLFVTYPDAGIQAIVTNEPPLTGIDMCAEDTIAYKIRSTKIGDLYNVISTITLPNYVSFISGSVEYKWPNAASWATAPNPTALGGNTYRFNISNYDATLLANGLQGILSPDSSVVEFRFRFKVNCGYVNGQRIRNNISAVRSCDGPIDPPFLLYSSAINILGLPDGTYTTTNDIDITGSNCGKNIQLRVSLINNGSSVTGTADTIQVTLPSNFSLASYNSMTTGSHNAPTAAPTVGTGSPQTLIWDFPDFISPGDSVVFFVDATLNSGVCSASSTAEVLSYVGATAICVTTGLACSAPYQTGIATSSTHNVALPDLAITEVSSFNANDEPNTFSYELNVTNNGGNAPANTVLEFFGDLNNDGMYTTGEPVIGTKTILSPIPNGTTINLTGAFTYSNSLFNPTLGDPIGAMFRAAPSTGGTQCLCAEETLILNTVLPVKMKEFKVRNAASCSNTLTWITSEEQNVKEFQVLYSTNGTTFTKVGTVAATGNSVTEQSYEFKHTVNANLNYYRLRIVDVDGKIQLTATKRITNSCEAKGADNGIVRFYPNPTNSIINLEVLWVNEDTKSADIFITDLTGRIVKTMKVDLTSDINLIPVDVQELAQGTYLINMRNGSAVITAKKFVKSN